MSLPSCLRAWTLPLTVIVAVGISSPALAAAEPRARLASCQTGNCLVVSGHRDSPAAAVMINGHAVPVQGARHWRVSLPVETIRAWSEPFARTIDVATLDITTRDKTAAEADLPIGLLGHADLSSVIIAVK